MATPALADRAPEGTAPALRGGASGSTAPALRGGASGGTAPALRGGASSSGETSRAPQTSSEVRLRANGADGRARRRVSEYLRALGLVDEARVEALAQELALASSGIAPALRGGAMSASGSAQTGAPEAAHPERAVAEAQDRIEAWRSAVFGEDGGVVHPLWMRAFLMAHPEALLADPELARACVRNFGDPRTGSTPARARFQDQSLHPARLPSWFKGTIALVWLTLAVTAVLLTGLAEDGLSLLELAWAALFAFLFGLSAVGLCTAAIGFVALRRRAVTDPAPALRGGAVSPQPPPSADEKLPRSALVMPIYHESAERVFAAIAAMRESLAATTGGQAFDILVLIDKPHTG